MSSGNTGAEGAIIERPCSAVRDRLLNVALQLFAEKGYESTSVHEIVSAAEVTKPAIYYYFKSKEGLYLELLDRLCETIENTVMLLSGQQGHARDRIESLILGIMDLLIKDDDNGRILYVLLMESRRALLFKLHERITNYIVTTISKIITDGVENKELTVDNVQDVTRSLFAYILLITYDNLFLQSKEHNKMEVKRMLDKLLNTDSKE